jgi:hypothetical protein
MLPDRLGSIPSDSKMKKTFYDKIINQTLHNWIILEDKERKTFIYPERHVYYQAGKWNNEATPYTGTLKAEARSCFIGYYITQEKGKTFTFEDIQEFYNPFENNSDVKLTYENLLTCYKLTDTNMKDKLNRFLAKRLLHGRN